jgi:hypothetical protein
MTTAIPNAINSTINPQKDYASLSTPNELTTLDALVNQMCFCKLREICEDKSSAECLKHRNLYAEFMLSKQHSA